jgi:leader peptidase (prepilin peptidase)/N-methyltransferase
VPKKLSVVTPPSACPSCGGKLTVLDLFPVLSWVFLRGKCRACKEKISPRYPLIELLCGLLFVAMAYCSVYNESPTLSAVPLMIFAFVLLAIAFIDADTMEIPDGLVITGAAAGVIFVAAGFFFPEIFPFARSWQDALLGVAAGAVPLLFFDRLCILILKKDGFGYGDVKLMAMAGLFLGWQMTLFAFLFAIFSATPIAVYLLASGKAKKSGSYIAFGPFLCMGILAAFFFGEFLLDAYFSWLYYY